MIVPGVPLRPPWRDDPTGEALVLSGGARRAAVVRLNEVQGCDHFGHGWAQRLLRARALQQQVHHLHGSADGASLFHARVDDLRQPRLILEILATPLQEVVVVPKVGRVTAVLACEQLQQEHAEAPYVVLRVCLALQHTLQTTTESRSPKIMSQEFMNTLETLCYNLPSKNNILEYLSLWPQCS